MNSDFSKKQNFISFIKFISPAIISMVFISLYTIIDGIFVSNYVGSLALASINIILPIITLIFGFAIMFASGGSAKIAVLLGEKNFKEANKSFTLLCIFPFITSFFISILALFFMKNIAIALGANANTLSFAITYGKIILLFTPVFVIKTIFEFFIRTDGNFNYSLFISIVGGVINIILDYIFIKVLNFGIAGAALATVIGVFVSTLFGVYYFMKKSIILKFSSFSFNSKIILETMINGSSEMVTEFSNGIATFIFNMLALKFAGDNGVAALTVVLYAQFFLISTYLGFVSGISPIISYNYGNENVEKLKETFNHSKKFLLLSAILIFVFSFVFSKSIVSIFVENSSPVYSLALTGMRIFSFSFLAVGFNVFASGIFTAYENGPISSIISISRALIFVLIGCVLLPPILKFNGVWLIVPFSEFATLLISIFFLNKYKNSYKFA